MNPDFYSFSKLWYYVMMVKIVLILVVNGIKVSMETICWACLQENVEIKLVLMKWFTLDRIPFHRVQQYNKWKKRKQAKHTQSLLFASILWEKVLTPQYPLVLDGLCLLELWAGINPSFLCCFQKARRQVTNVLHVHINSAHVCRWIAFVVLKAQY